MTFLNRQIKKYYRKTRCYSAIRYIVELVILTTLYKFLFVFFGLNIGELFHNDFSELQSENVNVHQNLYITEFIILAGLIAPLVETMIFQWLPIQILKKFTNDYIIIILITGFIFASAHLSYDKLYAFAMLPYGIIFSWVFYCKYKVSIWSALFYTVLIHSGTNLISVFLIIMGELTI